MTSFSSPLPPRGQGTWLLIPKADTDKGHVTTKPDSEREIIRLALATAAQRTSLKGIEQ